MTSSAPGFSVPDPGLSTREIRPDGLFSASAGGDFRSGGGAYTLTWPSPLRAPAQVIRASRTATVRRLVCVTLLPSEVPGLYVRLPILDVSRRQRGLSSRSAASPGPRRTP